MDDEWPLSLSGIAPVRLLGSGGFGRVWLARQTDLDRLVAVKVGHHPLTGDDDRRRFERECMALGRLSGHPNIVEVHTSGVDRDLPYLVLAYIDGGTLADHGPSLGEARLRRIAVELCQAVEAAHAERILHRDLKPENVFLHPEGRAVLGDFGIARLGDGNITTAPGLTASLAYVAPELLAGEPPSQAADVYGIGITIIAAALGGSPFVSDVDTAPATIMARVAEGRIPDLGAHGVSGDVERVLRWATDRDPARRPPSAEALRQAIVDLPPRSGPDGVVPAPVTVAAGGTTSGGVSPPTIPGAPPPDPPAGPGAPVVAPGASAVERGDGGRGSGVPRRVLVAIGAVVAAVLGVGSLLVIADGDGATDPPTGVAAPTTDAVEPSTTVESTTTTTTAATPPPPLGLPLTGIEISRITDIPVDGNGVDLILGPADVAGICDRRPEIDGLLDTVAGSYPTDPTAGGSLRVTSQRMHRFASAEQAGAFIASATTIDCARWEDPDLFVEGVTVLTAEPVASNIDRGDEVMEVDQRAVTPVGVDLLSRTTFIRRGPDVLELFYSTIEADEIGPVTDRLAVAAADNLGY
ncbi:MAG: serine/threonine-protein kinase [Actinomycetota bacterium]